MRKGYLLLLFWCFSASWLHSQSAEKSEANEKFKAALSSFLELKGLEGASISWCFRDMETGKVLEAYQEKRLLIPASTIKLYTTVAALDVLGPKYRYSTRMYLSGAVHRSRLHGDVVICGSGDPSLGHRNQQVLNRFREAIQQYGIERIRGRIEADPHALPLTHAVIPRDRTWEDLYNYYGSGVYGINWRNNSIGMYFSSYDSDSVVATTPFGFEYPEGIKSTIQSGASKATSEVITFFPFPFSAEIQVDGRVPSGMRNQEEKMAMPRPPEQFVRELSDSLERSEIHVKYGFGIRPYAYQPEEGDTLLAEYLSEPLSDLIKEVNRNSNNLYAEALARTTGMQLGSSGNAEAACAFIRRCLIQRQLTGDSLFVLREGSGLGFKNLVSTSGMTDLLQRAGKQTWFPDFAASLAEPGMPGTMRGFKPIKGLKAKTGSMGGVRAYSGYLTDASGRQLAFSIMVNHFLDGSGIRQAVEQVLERASACSFP